MKKFPVIVLLLISLTVSGQKVTYNYLPDTSQADIKAVMHLFEQYIASDPQLKKENPYWNTAEQRAHQQYDFLESEFQPSLYMGLPVHVLSIKYNNGTYCIKAQFSYPQPDGTPYVLAIVNYLAKKENGTYKLYNYLTDYKEQWNCTTVGLVDFYYPDYHVFDYDKAQQLDDFIRQTCENLGVHPRPFEYFLAADYDEIQSLKGIDYYVGMGGANTPRGKAAEDKVYCGGLGEYYPHEVFHVLIDRHFPDKHFWVSEGLATFLGGSRGKSLDWHLKRSHEYLKKHPEIDLNNLLQLTNLDDQTAYHYAIGGLIAKKMYEKGGWDLIRAFMSSGKSDDAYYQAIEQHLHIRRQDLNKYIRAELGK